MSKENVKRFYQALAKNEALRTDIQALNKKYAKQKPDDAQLALIYQKDLLPLARGAGFEFTLAELKEYAKEAKNATMHQLSEEELTAVSGGLFCQDVCSCVQPGIFG